eukprot:6044365-Prymnesium_polylepis.2
MLLSSVCSMHDGPNAKGGDLMGHGTGPDPHLELTEPPTHLELNASQDEGRVLKVRRYARCRGGHLETFPSQHSRWGKSEMSSQIGHLESLSGRLK